MGGFCLDMTHDTERVWPQGLNRLVLEPSAITYMLKEFSTISLSYLSSKEILDKSKADHLAKSLVCLQALWYCTNFFSRLAMALPVTLLELNTFAHSICALLIYMLWWEKPLDIGEPTLIKTDASETLRDFCAVCYSCDKRLWVDKWKVTEKSTGKPERTRPFSIIQKEIENWIKNEIGAITTNDKSHVSQNLLQCQISGVENRERPTPKFANRRPPIPSFKGLDTNECHYLFTSYQPPIIQLKGNESIFHTNKYVRPEYETIEIDETFLARIQRCTKFFTGRPEIVGVLGGPRRLSKRLANFTERSIVESRFKPFIFDEIQIVAITLSGIFYGGLHALSWDSTALKTGLETLLWKISCATIIAIGFLLLVIEVVHTGWNRLGVPLGSRGVKGLWHNFQQGSVNDCMFFAGLLLVLALSLLYILSRVFLIVEVFISLPHADPAVYRTPNWSAYWPHVS